MIRIATVSCRVVGFPMIVLTYLLIFAVVIGLARAVKWCKPYFYKWLSHLVDRYDVRPSTVNVGLAVLNLVWFGFLLAGTGRFLPGWALTVAICLGLSFAVAILVEGLRKPPKQECRPHWYKGEGKAEWGCAEIGSANPLSFSIFWVLSFVTIFCVLFGTQVDRLKNATKANRLHKLAVVRMQELDLQIDKGGNLRLLNMKPLSNEDLKTILGHKDLRNLMLHGDNVSDELLRVFQEAEADNLQALTISYASITADGLRHLAGMKNLERLTLQGDSITDEGLGHLTGMESLYNLHVGDTSVTGTGLSSLSSKKQFPAPYDDVPEDCKLGQLWITKSPLSEKGLRQIVLLKPLNVVLDETEASLEIVGKELPKESVSYINKQVRKPRPAAPQPRIQNSVSHSRPRRLMPALLLELLRGFSFQPLAELVGDGVWNSSGFIVFGAQIYNTEARRHGVLVRHALCDLCASVFQNCLGVDCVGV